MSNSEDAYAHEFTLAAFTTVLFHVFNVFITIFQTQKLFGFAMPTQGKADFSKMDEFLENFRTAFAPPPRPFFGKNVAIFQKFMTTRLNLQRNFSDRK